MGREAGFSAPQLAKARAAPVEMTKFWGGGRGLLSDFTRGQTTAVCYGLEGAEELFEEVGGSGGGYLAVLRMSSMGLDSLMRAARAAAMVSGVMG